MHYFGPQLAINLAIGFVLCLTVVTLDITPEVYFDRLDTASQRAAWRSALPIWVIAAAFIACLFAPNWRHNLLWRYSSPFVLAVAIGTILCRADVYGREWAIVMAYGTLIPVVLLVGPTAVMLTKHSIARSPWFRELFEYGHGHSAKWCTRPEYHRHQVELPRPREGRFGWLDKIYAGRSTFRDDFWPRDVAIKSDVHMTTIGMSGSAKSACAVWPVLGTYGGAALVFDLKGEHRLVTGRRRAELGWVRTCDPLDVTGKGSDRINPLAEADPFTSEGIELIRVQVEAIVLQENTLASGTHFMDNAKTVLMGVATHVRSTRSQAEQNWGVVYDLLNSINPKTGGYDPNAWHDLLAEMSQNPIGGGVCIQAAKLFDDAGADESGSFLTTISKSIKWLGHPGMRKHLSRSDFSMRDLVTSEPAKPTIYVCLGIGKEEYYKRYLRLMAAVALHQLRTEYRRTGVKPTPGVLIVLDEYALFAKGLECLSSGFGNLREISTCLWVQVQKISQLRDCLGDKAASLLLQNSTVQIFGVHNDDEDTAKWVSDTLGSHAVAEVDRPGVIPFAGRQIMQPLLTRREVMDALQQRSDKQIVFAVNAPPMWLRRMAYMPFHIDGRQVFQPLPLPGMFDKPRG